MSGAGSAAPAPAAVLRRLTRLSAAVAAPHHLPDAVRAAAAAGLYMQAEEVLLQSHLFAGYPAALEALRAWRAVVPLAAAGTHGRARPASPAGEDGGSASPADASEARGPRGSEGEASEGEASEGDELDVAGVRARGEAVCRTVYGGQYGALRQSVALLHPALERWMLEDGYGKVLGRPGLGLMERELCVVALAAGLDAPRQLYSHLRGALNAGATPEQVDGALAEAASVHTPERVQAASDVWRRVRDRVERTPRRNGKTREDG